MTEHLVGASRPENAPSAALPQTRIVKAGRRKRNPFWMKQLHTWHWVSSAISLVGLLLFATTGIMLNHAGSIEAKPVVVEAGARLPPALLRQLARDGGTDLKKPLPADVAGWVSANLGQRGTGIAKWSAGEVYLAQPRPGGDGWVAIDRSSDAVTSETTDRGWVSYLNDLHKGRNAGGAWAWFIDIFAAACVVFAATGFFLLQMHA